MKKIIVNGVIIVGLYVLFVLYLLIYSERIEQLDNSYKDSSLISINYGE
jgi:hypothetical protein